MVNGESYTTKRKLNVSRRVNLTNIERYFDADTSEQLEDIQGFRGSIDRVDARIVFSVGGYVLCLRKKDTDKLNRVYNELSERLNTTNYSPSPSSP